MKIPIETVENELVNPFKNNVMGAVLFGSVKDGKNDENSDLDIIIVTEDESTASRIREKAKSFGYFLDVNIIPHDQFSELVSQSDLFYKHEVLDKGVILYQRDDYLSSLRTLDKPDQEKAFIEYIKRFDVEMRYITYFFDNALDRLKWAYTDLLAADLSRRGVFPEGLSGLLEAVKTDGELSSYYEAFEETIRLAKENKHRRIDYPFNRLEFLYSGVIKLERHTRSKKVDS